MTSVDRLGARPRPEQPLSQPELPFDPSLSLRPGDVDLSDPKTFVPGVPHDYFRVLREEAPVHWQPECKLPGIPKGKGYWALTRYEDIAFV